ncbi:2-oxoglutarate carboxylase large subunit [bacterium HR29]|nr:2-oxoglutarate carboxylase large subunit [bacterium HR29]
MEKYVVSDGNGGTATYEVERLAGGEVRVRREGSETWHVAQLEAVGDSGLFLLLLDHRPVELYIQGRGRNGAVVTIGRHNLNYEVERWRPSLLRRQEGRRRPKGAAEVTAPMTGTIVEVLCAVGEHVGQGQVLLVMESMKMNNEIRAPAAGEVTAVEVAPGQRVTAGQVMLRIRTVSSGEEENPR